MLKVKHNFKGKHRPISVFHNLEVGRNFLNRTQKALIIKGKVKFYKIDYIKITIHYSSKNTIKRVRRQAKEWEEIYAIYMLGTHIQNI